ncbi:MAG: prephenate dehydrogenase/arogenate dehydrogenase family protein [Methanocorpusculum sp.]|nr:prephenate dehydrogenase/arogenate dehydrogenase family protein [Methanocorpusculum sp.]
MSDLMKEREELAEIDRQIMALVGRRNAAAEKIGIAKALANEGVVVPQVEKIVVERYVEEGKKHGVSAATASRIARAVIDESVDVQGRVPRSAAPKKIFIVGGNGGMGRWLSDFFHARGHAVSILDVNPAGAKYPFEDFVTGCKSDVIIVATPVDVSREILEKVFAENTDALIFDILSVKSPVESVLIKAAADGRRVCSVHPMFGPCAPSVAGRNIIVADCGCVSANCDAAELFSGGTILEMPILEHDKAAAYVLGLSHAVNLAFSDALVSSGFSFKELSDAASTTFRKQVAVSREVSLENAELYYAIQRENPKNSSALEKLEEAVRRVRKLPRDEFISMMHKEAEWYLKDEQSLGEERLRGCLSQP